MSRLAKRRAGFTLLEITFAVTIFSVIGYALVDALRMGSNTQATIHDVSTTSRWVRHVHSLLSSELKVTDEDHLTTTVLADGNTQLDFMHRIEAAGVSTWGVHDVSLGPNPEDQNRADWTYRYTVDTLPAGGGAVTRRLLRQLVDEGGTVQRTKVLAVDLRRGDGASPGFAVSKAGDMWAIEITGVGRTSNQPGGGTNFHVKLRN